MMKSFVNYNPEQVDQLKLPGPIQKITGELPIQEKCETVHSHYNDTPSHEHWVDAAPIGGSVSN